MNKKLFDMIVLKKEHHKYRTDAKELAAEYAALGLGDAERMTRRFEYLCSIQQPVILPDEKISFLRTVTALPEIHLPEEKEALAREHHIHEIGARSNLVIDYARLLAVGFEGVAQGVDELSRRSCAALCELIERYVAHAEEIGRQDIAELLRTEPINGAKSFRGALQTIRIANFALYLEGNTHNTLGRFDQYAYPYLKADLESGAITEEQALDLLEEFFVSLNRDTDLYPGVQQGDDGQSLMLGGKTAEGDGFNKLSRLCITASRNLKIIDPKINVRVDSNTPDEIFTFCSELTREGLGFPQYSNDDIVIPALIELGYAPEDAQNYAVAACWEFIIPAVGRDIPNIAALSFPKIIDTCLHRDLPNCKTAEEFLNAVKKEINDRCDELCSGIRSVYTVPSPLLDSLMGYKNDAPKYQNYGIHGVGLSTAADSITAIAEHVFEQNSITAQQLINAVDNDFADAPELLHLLRYETPKVGSNDDRADKYLVMLTDAFADALENKRNDLGGRWRAGTGSAMYYLWSAEELGASPDGRRKGEPFAANYSISLFAKPDGPFSLISSMTKPKLGRTINGGPLTLELHESVFSTPDSTAQVGQLVKQFVLLGGHQLQLNSVNAETLRDAQKNPEKYPMLIVRIWGWSAYFVELDLKYQNHVIARQEYTI